MRSIDLAILLPLSILTGSLVACSPAPDGDDELGDTGNSGESESGTTSESDDSSTSESESSTTSESESGTTSESESDTTSEADTTTGEPPSEVPEASRCTAFDLSDQCVEMSAGTWIDDAHYVWRRVDDDVTASVIERVPAEGAPTQIAAPSSISWHTLGGLAVAPDGSLWISGATLGSDVDLTIGETAIPIAFDYTWFVVHLDASGLVLDHEIFPTETSARVMVAARADGSVFLAGDLLIAAPIEFGPTTLEPDFGGDIVVARLDEHGQPLWARQRPVGEFGSLQLVDMIQSPDGLAVVDVFASGTTTFDGITLECPQFGNCDARWTFDAEGTVIAGELLP
ncbi:hypothetical protein ACNOYE_00490 [Nannocystaceae bacterium ST9]